MAQPARWAAVASVAVIALAACEPRPKEPRPAPPTADAPDGDRPLFPSRREQITHLERSLARELELTLASAPGVERARVHIALPSPTPLLGQAPDEPAKAFVLVQHLETAEPSWQAAEVQALVAGAVHGLSPETVTVVLQPLPAAQLEPASATAIDPTWVDLGPIRVERESADRLKTLLGGLSAASLLLVGLVLALWIRVRPMLRLSDDAPPPR